MRDHAKFRVGESWAYRVARGSNSFHEARVLSAGQGRPPRVRIELVDDRWQGERRWVSPARLEVRWDDRHEYIELDRKARAVSAWSPSHGGHLSLCLFRPSAGRSITGLSLPYLAPGTQGGASQLARRMTLERLLSKLSESEPGIPASGFALRTNAGAERGCAAS